MTAVQSPTPPGRDGDQHPAHAASAREPVPIAIRLLPSHRDGIAERFGPSDPPRGWDVTRYPRVARLLRDRRFHFLLILPNQVIVWTVIVRAWCSMCPFGGFAAWVQRHTFWRRTRAVLYVLMNAAD